MRFTGAIYLILLGLLLAVFGGGFTWLMWRSFERAAGQRGWEEHSCQILQSEVIERKIGRDVPKDYAHGLLFGYEVDGEGYTSDRLTIRGIAWSKSREKASVWVEEFPVGTKQVCHVDPADPTMAVLKFDTKAAGYSLWFPILLMVGGLGVAVGGVRGLMRGRVSGPAN